MNVKEAAKEPVATCELTDGRLAMFERTNAETYVRGYTVSVEQ